MTFGKFITKVDGVHELNREIKIWDPEKQKEYDCEVRCMNNTIYMIPKIPVEELKISSTPSETEGGCWAW